MGLNSVTKYEIIFLSLIVLLSVFVRFWNIKESRLIFGDEVFNLFVLSKPLFNVLSYNSSYFPTIILTKLFFFINSFPEYRYINATMGIISVILFYFTARLILRNKKIALLATILMSVLGYFVELDRLYMLDWSDMLFPIIILFTYLKWKKSQKNYLLPLIFLFSGIAINNHAPIIYFLVPLFLWFVYLLFKKEIQFKWILYSFIIFFLVSIPYIISFLSNPIDLNVRYLIYGLEYTVPYPVTLVNPHILLDGFIHVFTPIFTEPFIPGITPIFPLFLILFLLLVPLLLFIRLHSNRNLSFFVFISYGSIFLILISPLPSADGPTNFFPFFIFYICLSAKFLETKRKFAQIVFIPIAIMLLLNLSHVISIVSKQSSYEQLANVERMLISRNITELLVEKDSYEILKYTHYLKNIKYHIFTCEKEKIEPENLFDELHIKSGDIIISHGRCYYLRSYSKMNMNLTTIEWIDEVDVVEVK